LSFEYEFDEKEIPTKENNIYEFDKVNIYEK